MKYRMMTGQKTILLQIGLPGSLDCYFSHSYSEITALNLAILSQIAYWDDNDKTKGFVNNKIQKGTRDSYLPYIFRSFPKENPISNYKPFDSEPGGLSFIDTQGFSFQDPENLYLVFRGTEPRKARDWLTNFSATPTSFPFGPGRVHSGFSDAFGAVVPKLTEFLSNCDKSKNVIICGHSLGGALATLCAAWVRQTTLRQVMLYTFGSPRVGCRDFVEHYSKTSNFPAFRVANPTDIVPSVPWNTGASDMRKIESAVMCGPAGWILAELDRGDSDEEYYEHIGTPVSLRSPGYTIIGSPSAMDGEFAHEFHEEWRWMSMKEFLESRWETNIMHHLMDEYLRLLRTDFMDDCRNWVHGDPAPFQQQLQQVNADLADLEPQILKEQVAVYAPHPIAEPDASGTAFSRRSDVASPDRLKALELQQSQLQFQAETLRLRAQGATAEARNASLLRLTRRPMDKSLSQELLYQADAN